MRGEERDALEVRRVEALEGISAELARTARERRRRERQAHRTELFHLAETASVRFDSFFAGVAGQRLLMRIPAYVLLWKGAVPAEHLSTVCDAETRREWPLVRCRCGVATTLERFSPRECEGSCGRWFLALEHEVRFAIAPADAR